MKQIIGGIEKTLRISELDTLSGFHSGSLFFGVRQEVLELFDSPKVLINTSNMNALLGDIVEAQVGNVTTTSEELTIIGGTSSTTGDSWIYWNLPTNTTKVYASTYLNAVSARYAILDFCDSDGSTLYNPPNYVCAFIIPPDPDGKDFKIVKMISGTGTELGQEAVDLNYDTYYKVEMLYIGDGSGNNTYKVWRDDVLKFNISEIETGLSSIGSVRLRTFDESTSTTQSMKVKGEVIIIYE